MLNLKLIIDMIILSTIVFTKNDTNFIIHQIILFLNFGASLNKIKLYEI